MVPSLKLCCRLIQGSAQGRQVNKGGGSTEGKRPSALYGTWQKDTVRNQMCYTVPGKRIYGKGKDQIKRPSAINVTWQKKGLSMLYGMALGKRILGKKRI